MIIATAGHIDHGKTSLVRNLTGVDTDRLPEEKKRGMSIDLGFAYAPSGHGQILGFVDVPGHERFVRNMIAGVSGIDFALVVVAADDGPMPQTYEHIAILDILGIRAGAIALTKIDRSDAETLALVREEIDEMLAATNLAGAPVFALSNNSGEGIAALRAHLNSVAHAMQSRSVRGAFRMSIDRAFTVEGSGLVATGLVSSGKAAPGDHLLVSPAGVVVRIRGIHAQNRKSEHGLAGERCALNIAGSRLSSASIGRGMWLVAPQLDALVDRFDARLRLLKSEKKSLRHWTPVHLHIGAADIPARVAILQGKAIEPGESALVQIVMSDTASVLAGDRFIVRDQSAQRTLGGGSVIDPFAQARGRGRPERVKLIEALEQDNPRDALRCAVAVSPQGFAIGAFALAHNIVDAGEMNALTTELKLHLAGEGRDTLAFSNEQWSSWRQMAVESIGRSPANKSADGVPIETLFRMLDRKLTITALEAMLADAVSQGQLQHAGGGWRIAETKLSLSAADLPIWTKLLPMIEDDGLRPPTVSELAARLGLNVKTIDGVMRRAARLGLAIQISPNRFYRPDRLRALAEIAEAAAGQSPSGQFDARAFRDASNIGRNLTIEVLEHFDRMGLTRRIGDMREIRRPSPKLKWG